jgi:thiosulfate/3-mercaptopyruvate sulfurtransferase
MGSDLITASELQQLMNTTSALTILDVRWRLGVPTEESVAEYVAGHIPMALFVDLDQELAAPPDVDETPGHLPGGRHPLPSLEDFQEAVRGWAIGGLEDPIILYDNNANTAAARGWWLLRDAGFRNVRLLDGGLRAWQLAGGEIQTGYVTSQATNIELPGFGHLPQLDIESAAALPGNGVLLDARARDRYLGLSEPIDPRAGHIPGAKSAPSTENLDDGGFFLPSAQLAARFAKKGAVPGTPVGAYCGSGVFAAHEVFALRLAGIEASLYPGSWSQWSHTTRPAATGAQDDED